MPGAHETLEHALSLRNKCADRLIEYEQALKALDDDNPHRGGLHCAVTIRQGTAWDVDFQMTAEFVRPIVEGAVLKERAELRRMDDRLEAARKALQADTAL